MNKEREREMFAVSKREKHTRRARACTHTQERERDRALRSILKSEKKKPRAAL